MNSSNYERWAELSDRAAIGEPLSAVEQDFLRELGESDPVARAETALWESMAGLTDLDGSGNDLLDRAAANRAVESVLSEGRRASRTRVWAAGGALAAAAAVAAFVSLKSGSLERMAEAGSVVEYLGGEARADGVRIEQGAHLAPGTVVEAVTGPVCIAVESRIHACLASGAKVKLSAVGAPERRVDLLSGRVAAALDPLPRGERFSVVAGGVWSTAVGTAFTVELESNARVQTVVHEGKVAIGPERGGGVVGAHKIGLSHGDDVTVEPLVNHEKTETPEWVALALVAHRSIEGPMADAPAAPLPKVEATPEPPTAETASLEPKVVPVTKVAPPPAVDLLGMARQSLRDQRWGDAAGAYRKLIEVYPSSPEARTVAVPLAKLEIDRLGQPAAALPSLDAYIASGGTLVVEARSARIRAYRALGRSADELRAIDEFLAAHPSSLDAEKLRARQEELRGH
jgi:hypothetical protein